MLAILVNPSSLGLSGMQIDRTKCRTFTSAPKLVSIVLTFNSETSIAEVVQALQPISSRILVVDSFSTDQTLEIATFHNCEVVQHEFESYSMQRNWAQNYAELHSNDWVLHVDSDEVISEELAKSITQAISSESDISGYLVRRQSYFMGQPIKHGHINPSWHLRLFRVSQGFCENRLYDQHFVCEGRTAKLRGLLLDLQLTTLEKWTASHNRWSTAEALEVLQQQEGNKNNDPRRLRADLLGDLRMQKRWLKENIWYRSPLLFRCFALFIYSYFFRLGFLDGRAGLIYHILQTFWFRFLVDSKIFEIENNKFNALQSGSSFHSRSRKLVGF